MIRLQVFIKLVDLKKEKKKRRKNHSHPKITQMEQPKMECNQKKLLFVLSRKRAVWNVKD